MMTSTIAQTDFGDALKRARAAAKLTQEQLAVHSDVSAKTVRRIEGGAKPSPKVEGKLLRALRKFVKTYPDVAVHLPAAAA